MLLFVFITLIQSWQSGPSMPTPRYGFGIGVVGNKIYVIGGYNNTTILDVVEVYNTTTNSWDTGLVRLPTPRYDVGSAVYNGKIYIIGGRKGQYWNTSLVERYDPVEDKWNTVTNLPEARAALGACVYQNNIYAVGGFYWDSLNYFYEKKVEYLSPPDTIWWRADSLNTRRSNLSVAVLNNRIYALGGSYYGSLNEVEAYFNNNWYYTTSMPNFRSGLGVASHGNYIYAIGGEDSIVMNSVDIFFEPGSTWTAGPALNQRRSHFGVAIVGDTIYVIGGQSPSGPLNSMEYHSLPLTGIIEDQTGELPSSHLFPTLVRKGTDINFTEGDEIKIYNSVGALIIEGRGSVRMDMPQGIYFIQLHRKGHPVVTKKIIVVK